MCFVMSEMLESCERNEGDTTTPLHGKTAQDEQFADLYKRYRAAIYKYCLQQVGDPVAAQDAVQETFVRAYASFSRFDPGRKVLPWLGTIATNICVDMHRRTARISVMDPFDQTLFEGSVPDEPLHGAINFERRQMLVRALRSLPDRQRRVLLRHALEECNYADLASAEGISPKAVKSLLFRARDQLRNIREMGLLSALSIPFIRVRARVGRGRFSSAGSAVYEATVAFFSSQLPVAILALTTLTTPSVSTTFPRSESARATQQTVMRPIAQAPFVKSARNPGTYVPRGTRIGPIQLGIDTRDPVDPTKDASPEGTLFDTFVPSPNYKRDHTIFAAGHLHGCLGRCLVLFVSRDAGATWKQLRAESIGGTAVMLPPAYPRDNRIFAMSADGLRVSTDGGNSFSQVYPLDATGAAISPLFNERASERRILMGDTPTVMEYWPDKVGLQAGPAPLALPPGNYSHIAFSPDYRTRPVIFAASMSANQRGLHGSYVDRCEASICSRTELPANGRARFVFSPSFAQDDTMYTYTPEGIFVSRDAGETYRKIKLPSAIPLGGLNKVAVGTDYMYVASPTYGSSGVYRSSDEGRTWTAVHIDIDQQNFEPGAWTIEILPDGRLLAGGNRGLACSLDQGRSWSARCSTE